MAALVDPCRMGTARLWIATAIDRSRAWFATVVGWLEGAESAVHRPGFEKAIRVLLDRRIRTLYVAKVDRLTQHGVTQVDLILDELEKVGGRIVFVAEGLDSSKPGARQIIAILAEQARAEADAISWRIGQWHLH